ncbi:ABC transporter substrate-binding protein [Streptomyces sp. WAC05374]|uniref:ABC transporter substrate-binding protein n=1 Tax=Streptomyces sp. WAC05374 TaxID=2487420 RepID=UPI000F85CDB0|nr:ABC transporter substrate-binding protein [Streptomyces sp. WAC05374]RST17689.1 ABC transporter substrate-binding protein [Streptomyces sp. WAC05374]TDF52690.1 ABC transporter substrate-binding protein [Streptomyces sp. WAC05374]TDF54109.1 ABC transporter substrate-binding protein [Streptomyces sp. WAC05374]
MALTRPTPSLALLACGVLLLTGCGRTEPSPAAGAARVLDNCGEKVEIAPGGPRRAVSLNQGTTEILLSLGLADRMAGTATWTDPVMKGLEKANATVERLAENNPSFEKVLDTEPDFVTASFASTLGKGGVAPRERFHTLGVPTYLSPSDCVGKDNSGDGDGVRTKPLTMDTVHAEVRDLARVFGVEKRGDDLVARLTARVTRATTGLDASGVTLLYWFSDAKSPYMAGCCGAPGIITRELGAQNVFDDTTEEWPQINWETVADRNPDVLVIGDLTRKAQTGESAAKKIEFLESNPVTRNMDAVRHKRYVLLSGQAMNPTIRTVEGIEQVAAALRAFGLAK